jgi:hypothetical protein
MRNPFRRDPRPGEVDAQRDDAEALSRATGGDAESDDPNTASTTSPSRTEEFVGRAAGDDLGYSGETGAERREQAESD